MTFMHSRVNDLVDRSVVIVQSPVVQALGLHFKPLRSVITV